MRIENIRKSPCVFFSFLISHRGISDFIYHKNKIQIFRMINEN